MAKVGDRVSLDPVKVGQPRRHGAVTEVTSGIAGERLWVEWDDGTKTSIGAETPLLRISERRAKPKARAAKPKPRARAAKPKPKARNPKRKR